MDQSVFADVEVARAGAATPAVRLAFGDAVLKPIEACVIFVTQFLNFLEDVFLFLRKGLQRSVIVMNYTDGSRKA